MNRPYRAVRRESSESCVGERSGKAGPIRFYSGAPRPPILGELAPSRPRAGHREDAKSAKNVNGGLNHKGTKTQRKTAKKDDESRSGSSPVVPVFPVVNWFFRSGLGQGSCETQDSPNLIANTL